MRQLPILLAALIFAQAPAADKQPAADQHQARTTAGLRLNEIQVLGSHNSYKLAMPADNFAALHELNATTAASLEYWHIPLTEQLDLGVRKLELDIFFDPRMQLFENRSNGRSQFPVLHVQNLDDRSSCLNLIACLEQLVAWSDEHPQHVPIFLSFNAKDDVIDRPGFVIPFPFGEDAWMAMDAELRAILGPRLIVPAEVFATGTLRWPDLATVRGRFVAILDEGGDKRATYANRWRGRAMFANLSERQPGAAIMIVNDPLTHFDRIQRLVRAGYIVRTRADADTREARLGDNRRRDRALASGAQLISTDYYRPADHFGTAYVVAVPEKIRCNPLLRSSTTCKVRE